MRVARKNKVNQEQKVIEMRNAEYRMIINGRAATPEERKRILNAKASKPDKSRASAPIQRSGFSLMR